MGSADLVWKIYLWQGHNTFNNTFKEETGILRSHCRFLVDSNLTDILVLGDNNLYLGFVKVIKKCDSAPCIAISTHQCLPCTVSLVFGSSEKQTFDEEIKPLGRFIWRTTSFLYSPLWYMLAPFIYDKNPYGKENLKILYGGGECKLIEVCN